MENAFIGSRIASEIGRNGVVVTNQPGLVCNYCHQTVAPGERKQVRDGWLFHDDSCVSKYDLIVAAKGEFDFLLGMLPEKVMGHLYLVRPNPDYKKKFGAEKEIHVPITRETIASMGSTSIVREIFIAICRMLTELKDELKEKVERLGIVIAKVFDLAKRLNASAHVEPLLGL